MDTVSIALLCLFSDLLNLCISICIKSPKWTERQVAFHCVRSTSEFVFNWWNTNLIIIDSNFQLLSNINVQSAEMLSLNWNNWMKINLNEMNECSCSFKFCLFRIIKSFHFWLLFAVQLFSRFLLFACESSKQSKRMALEHLSTFHQYNLDLESQRWLFIIKCLYFSKNAIWFFNNQFS